MRPTDTQRIMASIRTIAGRLAALERDNIAFREALAEERAARERLAARVLELERAAAAPSERVPLAQAAKALGVSRKHAYRLGLAGVLDLLDLREPGAPRATWSVSATSLERLLEARRHVRPGLPGQAKHAGAGRRRRNP